MGFEPTGVLCVKHGGTYKGPDAFWYCDECARSGIKKCKCGGHARYFGEALFGSVNCETCDESVGCIHPLNPITLWNEGKRGFIDPSPQETLNED